MCVSYGTRFPISELLHNFPDLELPLSWEPREKLFPSNPLLVILLENDKVEAREMSWGLLPSWEEKLEIARKKAVINVRAETVFEKPFFSASANRRRCLLPASHFYEWAHLGNKSKPFVFKKPGESLLLIAGIWNSWHPSGNTPPFDAVGIITVAPNLVVAPIHNRMPAILSPEQSLSWLDNSTPVSFLKSFLVSAPNDLLESSPA